MSDNKENLVLILERSDSNLAFEKKSGEYILEGVFAQFGVENNNKRVYEEKEYLPHLKYLNEKVAEKRLMGELDHPDKFEVSLNKVSHIIESLEYDKETRQVFGKVRLLDTPSGKIAKNLVDSGVPISISSRAAGSVNEDKSVNIKRIFTYDLVADPGFPNAQLNQINESFGLGNDDPIQIYDASKWDFNFQTGDKKQDNDFVEKINETVKKENNVNMDPKNYVTVEAMNKYSVIIKEEMKKLNTRLDSIYESNTGENISNDELNKISRKVDQLVEYTTLLSKEITNNRGYAERLREGIETGLNEAIAYSEKELGLKLDQLTEYVNEEVQPHVSKLINHNNHIVEKLNQSINYSENELAKRIDESIAHNDHLTEEINKNRAYASYLSENAIDREDFENLVEYTETIYENVSGTKLNKSAKKKDTLNENKIEDIKNKGKKTTDKIDALLETINKQKINENSEGQKYPFLKLISEENRAVFSDLNETKKEKVKKELLETNSYDSVVLNTAFENACNENAEPTEPAWLKHAPEKYRKIYESLDEAGQKRIQAQAQWYNGKLNTEYQIKNFWQTRGLNENVELENESGNKINESVDSNKSKANSANRSNLGYDSDYVNVIKESLGRFQ